MRTTLSLTALIVLSASVATAGPPVTSAAIECNWGKLTAESAPLGDHSSDPNGDGPGNDNRVGLANVIELGNLQATCEFIEAFTAESSIYPSEPDITSVSVKCNWGKLTMDAAPLGEHSSDPSGDGLGREDRVGLANIIEQGNLHAVCELLSP